MSGPILLLIVLIEGFVTISVEILTIRQLLPVVGNSVVVTSLIIGIFLLFLAYGYRRGGQYQTAYVSILKRNFTKSAICLGIGLSYIFIDLFFVLFDRYINHNILAALVAYLLIVTAPLIYFLGQTVPITMNLMKGSKTTGEIGAKVLHISTIGSFLGAVLTSLLFMNYVGVAWTIVFNFCLLIILTLLLPSHQKSHIMLAIVLLCALGVVYIFNVEVERKLFVKTNAYADYQVLNGKEDKFLIVNKSLSSSLTAKKHGFLYIESIKKKLFKDLKLKGKNILVLGAGGFTLSAGGTYGNHFTYVDIDKEVKTVVHKHFLRSIQGKFISEDARVFLRETQDTFDVIVFDVYSNRRSIPAHLLTQEFFNQINLKLKPAGIAVLNIIARPTLEDAYSAQMDDTIHSVFKNCMVIPENYTHEFSNIIYLCKNNPNKVLERRNFYTDNLNRATLDFFKSITHFKEHQ